MKTAILTLTLLTCLLPAVLQAQKTPEVKEIALNDSLSVRLRQITREECKTRRQTSAYLQHKPYKAVTDIDRVKRMLRGKVKEMDVPFESGEEIMYLKEMEITFKDGTKERIEWTGWDDYAFIAYYPELGVLVLRSEADGEYTLDLNDREKSMDKVGNPKYYAISPDRRWRINAYYPGGAVDGMYWFLDEWNKSGKKYKNIACFMDYMDYSSVFYYAGNWCCTDNNTVIFTNLGGTEVEHINEDTEFYEMKIIEK